MQRACNEIENLGTKECLRETKRICQAALEECDDNHREDEREAEMIDRAIKEEDKKLTEKIEEIMKTCGYGFAEETTSTEPYKKNDQAKEERREASRYRRQAEELDRTTKCRMKSAIAAIPELDNARWKTTTMGFRSYALTDNRVQEAAAKNRRD